LNYGLVLDGSEASSLPTVTGYAGSNLKANGNGTTRMSLCLVGQRTHCRSKRQTVLAGSSNEAEIMAINSGALYLKWIKMLEMVDLGMKGTETVLYGYNTYCIKACKDPRSSDRTRDIDGQFKKVQELVKNNVRSFEWIPTKRMLADCLSKQLYVPELVAAREALEVQKIKDCRLKLIRRLKMINLFKAEDLFVSLLAAASLLCFQAASMVPSAFVCGGVWNDVGYPTSYHVGSIPRALKNVP
jgi:hypothetical protein